MIEALQRSLTAAGIKYVRFVWCDNANIIRAKATHIDFRGGMSKGVSIAAAQQALPVMADAVAPGSGLGPVGEVQLRPDWGTLSLLPYAPGQAQVLCDMVGAEGPWKHCPRTFLKTQLAELENHGITLKAAFENEFVFLRRSDNRLIPADTTLYAAPAAMNLYNEVILAITDVLTSQGLELDYYYPESAPGQQELSVRYTEGLSAADQQLIFRETVRGVAQQHGFVASFLPKISEKAAGSGCHINLSLWQRETNVTGSSEANGLSQAASAFIAGILVHLPALCALTLASPNSYRRIQPHFWAGAFTAWGYGNREAAIRATRGDDGAANRFEVKAADATANPYLALGAIIAAGLDGITRNLVIPEEVTSDPADLSEEARRANAVSALPTNLGEALGALEADQTLRNALGTARYQAYAAVKTMEWEAMKDFDLEGEKALLLERY